MENFMQAVGRFIRDEEGATAIEYGLIAALISIVMLISLTGVGNGVQQAFQRICETFRDAAGLATGACS